MKIIAIDPGPVKSAYVAYDNTHDVVFDFGIEENETLAKNLSPLYAEVCVCEMLKSYGNVVGDSVLETCVWVGRFWERWTRHRVGGRFERIHRKAVVTEICRNPRAKDKNVRQALIDRWGGPEVAIGKKVKQGPLYGVSKDVWSALAVAVAWSEIEKQKEMLK